MSRKNEMVQCACGCGGWLLKFDANRKERKFIHPHQVKLGYVHSPIGAARQALREKPKRETPCTSQNNSGS